MTGNEHTQDDAHDRPDDVQNISTQDLVDNNYDVDLKPSGGSGTGPDVSKSRGHAEAAWEEPGRTRHDDSIDASSHKEDRTDDGYDLSTKPEMSAATYVGKPDDPYYDEELQRMNDSRDRDEGSLGQRQNEWDKKRISQAICSQIPISKRQREKVVNAMESLNLERFGQQKAIERVCLGAVAVIVNDERVEQTDNPEDVTPVSWEDEFKAIANRHDVSMSDLSTIKSIVRDELEGQAMEPVTAGYKRDMNLPKTSISEKPDEYWEHHSPREWETIARMWENQEDEYKETVPDEKRELIRLLQKWKPWEQFDDPTLPDSEDREPDPIKSDEKATEIDEETIEEELDLLNETVEAEALVEQMEADDQ